MKIPGTNKALLDGLEGSSRANRELDGEDIEKGEGKEKQRKGGEEVRGQVQRSQSAGAEEGIGKEE